ncbi:MAG: pyridoxamine 5'-phosphate oxidase family protein [Acidobacteriota bacterium]|nr:pyridoxamine 5'-phosphate oxidase family protein [Acidobacteriota bacterium]
MSTRVRRHPERGAYDRQTVDAILDDGFLCHVGFVLDGQPYVIPMLHARAGDVLYLHGSPASRLVQALASGARVCATVTHLDGIVLAKSVFNHSVNYRSAVVLGSARIVEGDEKLAALEAIVNHVEPGRWEVARQPNDKELRTTEVIALPLDECSAKIRTGPPTESPHDDDLDVPSGVVQLRWIRE